MTDAIPKPQFLTGAAEDVMWSLFVHGPTMDGDVPSKAGRDQLVELKLADRHDGYNWLTSDGVIAAVDAGFGPRKEKWDRERRERRA